MTLAQVIEEYVTVKRATGLRFRSAATILRTFARVAGVIDVNDVTQDTVRAFLKRSGPITSGWHQKHYTLAGLFRFAMQRGLMSTSPVLYRLPKRPAYARPTSTRRKNCGGSWTRRLRWICRIRRTGSRPRFQR